MEERRVLGEGGWGGGGRGGGGLSKGVAFVRCHVGLRNLASAPTSLCASVGCGVLVPAAVLKLRVPAAVLKLRRPRSLMLHYEHVTALRQSALLRAGGDALLDDGTRVGRHLLGTFAFLCFPVAAATSASVLVHRSSVHVVGSRSGPLCASA